MRYQVDIEIGYFCVSDIIAVWLEREAENQHVSLRSLELSVFIDKESIKLNMDF